MRSVRLVRYVNRWALAELGKKDFSPIAIESSQPAHLVYVPVGGGSPWNKPMILVFEETDE